MIVEKITKKGNYYNLKFTNGDSYKLKEDILIKYNLLKPKSELDDDLLSDVLEDNDYYIGLDSAYKFLEKAATKYDIKMYLLKKYSEENTDKIISHLEELKLIDDLKYANLYIPYGLKMGYGKNKIKAKLLEHGVSEFDINLALETIDEKEYLDNLNHEFGKFIPTLKPQSAQNQKRKTIAHMVSRGYEEELALYYLEKNSYLLDNISNDELFIEKDFEKISKKLLKKNLDKNIYREKVIQGLLNKGYSYSIIKKLLEKGNL